jgi:predicted heme/steroid binding protein
MGHLVTLLTQKKANPFLSFDGINDYVNVVNTGGIYDFSGSFTLEGGVYVRSFADPADIIDKNSYNQYRVVISEFGELTTSIRFTDGADNYQYFDGYFTSQFTPTLNTWFYFSFVFNLPEEKVYMYINGTLFGSKSTPVGMHPTTSNTDLQFGRYAIIDTYLDGMIVAPRMWNIARSASAIAGDYNKRLSGQESGLVGYWKLDEGKGNIVHDSSPNHNNGTILGAIWVG